MKLIEIAMMESAPRARQYFVANQFGLDCEECLKPPVMIAEFNPTIYLIDDDHGVREILSFLLRSEGYSVRGYESGRTFLDNLEAGARGCLVTDVRMPEISGLDLLARIRDRRMSLPTIVMTGFGDIPLAVEAMKQGAADFLQKPIDSSALLAAVRKAVLRSKSEHARDAEIQVHRNLIASLTPREKEVLARLARGQKNKIIAHELGVSVRCIEAHRGHLMAKMGVRSLPELVQVAMINVTGDAYPWRAGD